MRNAHMSEHESTAKSMIRNGKAERDKTKQTWRTGGRTPVTTCLRYPQTHVVRRAAGGQADEIDLENTRIHDTTKFQVPHSEISTMMKFQWLPTKFQWQPSGMPVLHAVHGQPRRGGALHVHSPHARINEKSLLARSL